MSGVSVKTTQGIEPSVGVAMVEAEVGGNPPGGLGHGMLAGFGLGQGNKGSYDDDQIYSW